MAGEVTLESVTNLVQKAYDNMPAETIFGTDATPFRNNCTLENNAAGEGYTFEIISEGSTVVSPNYAVAGGALSAYRFSVKPVTYHLRATVTKEAIDSLKGKGSKAMFDLAKKQLDIATKVALRKIDRHLGSKNGAIGTASSEVGSTITLDDPSQVNKLLPGMVLVGATANGSGNLFNGELTVVSWTDAGVITFLEDVGTENFTMPCTLWEKGDVLSNQAARISLTGGIEWVDPVAASNGEDFHGVDRFDSAMITQPSRKSYSGVPLRTALLRAAGTQAALGKPVNRVYVSEKQYTAMREEADVREIVTISVEKSKSIVIGCEAIKLSNLNGGTMDVIMWRFCPNGIFLMGDDKEGEFKLIYTDKLVRLHTDGGGLWQQVQGGITNATTGLTEPALRAEGSIRLNLINKSPAHWHVGTDFTGA